MNNVFREESMIDLRGKKVAFISFWSISDSLTIATVFPQIRAMQQLYKVKSIVLFTIEREKKELNQERIKGFQEVLHQPLFTSNFNPNVLNKIADFVYLPRQITSELKRKDVDVVFAHSAPAGALAYLVWKRLKIPFYVSSFEPHADYMAESGVWGRRGLKYIFQKYWEKQQFKHAAGLMPVSISYRNKLISSGVAVDKVKTVPITVEQNAFRFEANSRIRVRKQLGFSDCCIGVYAGKYGDLYYKEEAIKIYKRCFDLIPDFRLIILSPQPKAEILELLQEQGVDTANVYIDAVPHHEVAAYLSAADFAFATFKPGPSKKYLSPVKIGEYWANGLPVMLTEGIGDDSGIIKHEGGGVLFNLKEQGSVERAITQMLEIVKETDHRQKIAKLAIKYRSPERIKEAYEYFFGKGQEVNK